MRSNSEIRKTWGSFIFATSKIRKSGLHSLSTVPLAERFLQNLRVFQNFLPANSLILSFATHKVDRIVTLLEGLLAGGVSKTSVMVFHNGNLLKFGHSPGKVKALSDYLFE